MRLTERKVSYPKCDKQGNLTRFDYIEIKNGKLAEEKLCQLEDIEEELGIDLSILFKALRNGIYSKDGDSWLGTELHLSFKGKALFYEFDDGDVIHHEEWFYFKDYGKTWALTREELTDGK